MTIPWSDDDAKSAGDGASAVFSTDNHWNSSQRCRSPLHTACGLLALLLSEGPLQAAAARPLHIIRIVHVGRVAQPLQIMRTVHVDRVADAL